MDGRRNLLGYALALSSLACGTCGPTHPPKTADHDDGLHEAARGLLAHAPKEFRERYALRELTTAHG